jgi:hypothetical protein
VALVVAQCTECRRLTLGTHLLSSDGARERDAVRPAPLRGRASTRRAPSSLVSRADPDVPTTVAAARACAHRVARRRGVRRGREYQPIAERRRTLDLRIDEAQFAEFKTAGIPWSVTLTPAAKAREVRLVVYQFSEDRLGSIVTRIR